MIADPDHETDASRLDEIRQIVARGETEQVEFKASTGQRTEAAKAVCGMLNASGGFVVFGVRDDGALLGQGDVRAETVEAVVRELRRIEPQPYLSPECIPLENGRTLILVRVPRGDGPYTFDGRAYLRVGPTTLVMTAEQYRRILLERAQSGLRWETLPAADVGIADLDHDEIRRTAEEAIRRHRISDPGTRRIEDLLTGFRVLLDGRILNAAVVLFGRSDRIQALYPQCALRMARFRGRDTSEFVDHRREHGNAFHLFQRAQAFLRDHLPVAGRITPGLYERVDDPLYPPVALREALANALCHRDYGTHGGSVAIAIFDDRLEITSTGPLRFGLRPEHLSSPHPSLPWNPTIASTFYLRGVIEQWGRGTIKIRELASRAGLDAPEFEERAGEVVVRFPAASVPDPWGEQKPTPLQSELLSILAARGPASAAVVQSHLRETLTVRHVQRALKDLRDSGYVERIGAGRSTEWRAAVPTDAHESAAVDVPG